jgi:hypothetical protein
VTTIPRLLCNSLDRALYCFEQLGDDELCRMVRVHRSSVLLRSKLESFGTSNNRNEESFILSIEFEEEASQVLDSLLAVGLLLEARKTCNLILPRLSDYSKEGFERNILSRLPLMEDA